jgi:hypothetical protein
VSILTDSMTRYSLSALLTFLDTQDRWPGVISVGFDEVVQAVDPVGRVILHEEHDRGSVFCPREQEQMIGAEVEDWRQRTKERRPVKLQPRI